MEINKFIEVFADQFEDTDISEFTPTTKFKELEEWSSLIALSIIAFVKTEYNKEITAEQVLACDTIQKLYNIIEKL